MQGSASRNKPTDKDEHAHHTENKSRSAGDEVEDDAEDIPRRDEGTHESDVSPRD